MEGDEDMPDYDKLLDEMDDAYVIHNELSYPLIRSSAFVVSLLPNSSFSKFKYSKDEDLKERVSWMFNGMTYIGYIFHYKMKGNFSFEDGDSDYLYEEISAENHRKLYLKLERISKSVLKDISSFEYADFVNSTMEDFLNGFISDFSEGYENTFLSKPEKTVTEKIHTRCLIQFLKGYYLRNELMPTPPPDDGRKDIPLEGKERKVRGFPDMGRRVISFEDYKFKRHQKLSEK